MNTWFTIYMTGFVFCSVLAGMVNDIDYSEPVNLLSAIIFVVFWPIMLPLGIGMNIRKALNTKK
jgi:hypothetical protein